MKSIISASLYYIVILIIASAFIIIIKRPANFEVDAKTKELCRWYANLDHQGEISPQRWEWGHEWISKYDWYGSCLKHVEMPEGIRY